MERLTKSSNKIISGVIGGVAEYFGISSAWLRFGFVLLLLIPGLFFPLFIIYVIAAIVMPEPDVAITDGEPAQSSRRGLLILGTIFILFGLFFLLNQILPIDLMYYFRYFIVLSKDYLVALVLIIIGLLFIFKSSNTKERSSRQESVTLQREEISEEKELVEKELVEVGSEDNGKEDSEEDGGK